MINRIFKTILILTICLGLTIPTNAAVSVSDGSAFVTKAEFAADLNNLSNRMAQLENSLDAKIDSLVSSYLTRNGIWNGAKQDCGTSFSWKKSDGIWNNSGTDVLLTTPVISGGGATTGFGSENFQAVTTGPEYTLKKLTNTPLNKTGLLCATFDVNTMGDYPIWGWKIGLWGDHTSNWYEECGIIVNTQDTIPTGFDYRSHRLYTDTIMSRVDVTNWYRSTPSNQTNMCYPFRFSSQVLHKQWYAFVNKDTCLWFYYRFVPKVASGGLYARTDTTTGNYDMLRINNTICYIY